MKIMLRDGTIRDLLDGEILPDGARYLSKLSMRDSATSTAPVAYLTDSGALSRAAITGLVKKLTTDARAEAVVELTNISKDPRLSVEDRSFLSGVLITARNSLTKDHSPTGSQATYEARVSNAWKTPANYDSWAFEKGSR